MRKTTVVVCAVAWLLFCTGTIYSKTRPIEFEIHYDSKSEGTYRIKKGMQESYDELVSGLHVDSQRVMVMNNLDQFETEKDVHASWEDKLVITQGDGLGIQVEGELTQSSYCVEKVQPRSFLQELFQ